MAGLKKLNTRIINKHATAAVWNDTNFIPLQGEIVIYDPGYDSKDGKTYTRERMKIGDGSHNIQDLPFVNEVEYNHSQAAHAPSDAEKNQNAFSNIAVSGQSTVSADSTTDTLTLVAGTNVTITTDATNDKVTISAAHTHPTTIASSTGTNELTLSHGGKYSLTAGGDSFVFTMPNDNNSSHSHSAGVGLTGSGSAGISGTYTYKVNLVNETVASNAASYTAGGSSKFYAVQLDKNSKLGVYVPWTDTDTDTHYTTGITAGASGTTTNAIATNPYIKVKDNSTHRSQIRLLGSNGLNVKSDASGNVTVGANEVTVNVPTTGWTTDSTYGNKVTITVSGVTAGSNPVADVVLEGSSLDANKTLLEQWSYISKITTASNSVTLYAFETVPTIEFPILMKFI